jgi:triphosphatase
MGESHITEDARQFAVAQAHAQLKHLAVQIQRAARSCNADAVHDVRVAIRRFAQSIAVCRRYFRHSDLHKHCRRLKKIMASAGEVRNCDVALKFVSKFHAPHAAHLQSKLEERREESANLLMTELGKWTNRRIAAKWRATLDAAPAKDTPEPSRELAQRTLARSLKDFLKQGEEAASAKASPEMLHRFRIGAKKFRYSLELFQPLYGTALDESITRVKHGSALLGDINDCVTVGGIVAGYKGGNKLAERLRKRQHKKTEEFRQYWKEVRELSVPDLAPLKKPVASSDRRRRSAA